MTKENKQNFKVDFIGVGEEKSATSWIFKCLVEHPEVCGSKPKETHFFSKNYHKGLNWYKNRFKECKNDCIKGEYTPAYMRFEQVPIRIKNNFPNVKLIFSFRNPVERMISKYHFDYSRAKTNLNIDEYFKSIKFKNISYTNYLKDYLAFFPLKNMHFILFDEIKENPRKVIKEVYDFLEVDSSYVPNINKKVNQTVSNLTKFRFINRFMWIGRKFIKKNFSCRTVKFFKKIGLNKIAKLIMEKNRRRANFKNIKKEKPSFLVLKNYLELIQDDIKDLEKIITNKDFSHWFKKER